MVKHIIFFTLKEDANKDAVITAAEKALMPLVGKIPGLTKMEVRRCFSGPDFVLYSELESREALAVYADHPAHIEAKSHFFPWVQGRACLLYTSACVPSTERKPPPFLSLRTRVFSTASAATRAAASSISKDVYKRQTLRLQPKAPNTGRLPKSYRW